MQTDIIRIIRESLAVKGSLETQSVGRIESAARAIIESLAGGGKLLVCGNGGSAADSQHMVAELVGRFKKERKPLPAIALTVNTSILTAIANDYSYDVAFARQIEALGRPGDVALGISTSGNSRNVVEALKTAKALGLKTIGLTGALGGDVARECDITIAVGSNDTPRIQESHLLVIHILCELIENELIKR